MGFFERKLPEYQKVYNWYLKNENHHRISSAAVCFSGGDLERLYEPKFQKTIDKFLLKPKEDEVNLDNLLQINSNNLAKYFEQLNKKQAMSFGQFAQLSLPKIDWHQNFWFKLCIENTGQTVIEDFKLEIDFDGDFIKVGHASPSGIFSEHFSTDVNGYSNTERSLYVKPTEKTLVQGDSYTTDSIFLKPMIATASIVTIHWKLLARDFEDSGTLRIKIEPMFHQVISILHVESAKDEKEEFTFELIKRPGSRQMLNGFIDYDDNETDYTFVKL